MSPKKKQQFSEEPVELPQEVKELIDAWCAEEVKEMSNWERTKRDQAIRYMLSAKDEPQFYLDNIRPIFKYVKRGSSGDRLNEEEYVQFYKRRILILASKGLPTINVSEEKLEACFNMLNKIN